MLQLLAQQVVNGLMAGAMYALIAVGYTLVFGVLNMLNMAHGDIFMIAAFLAVFFLSVLGTPLWLGLLAAVIGAGIMGIILQLVCFQPVRKDIPFAPALATMGFGMILTNVAVVWKGSLATPLPVEVNTGEFWIGDTVLSILQLLILGTAIVMMVGLHLLVTRTKLGRSIRAIAENRDGALLMGVSVTTVVLATFFISSFFAGAGGLMLALKLNVANPFLGFTLALKGLAIMAIGGLGHLQGAMVAAFFVGLVEVLSVAFLSATISEMAAWVLLVLILLFRPYGLLGSSATVQRF